MHEPSMKNLDSANVNDDQRRVSPRLTRVPPLWNHPKTVSRHFASGKGLSLHAQIEVTFAVAFP
jgi:hypothetical protein